jgi:ABC-type antimicrobial peptide transport system permease subunit
MQMPDSFVAPPSGSGVMLRYEGNLSAVLDSIRSTNRQMSSQQVIYGVQTMESLISDSLAARRFAMMVLGAFAVLALVLASVGIYGVIAYIVGQRTQEIGIRMALGAQRNEVLRLVVAGALVLTRLMTRLLYGVTATDPLTFAALALMLTLVAIAACCLPASRAMRVDPVVALRYE